MPRTLSLAAWAAPLGLLILVSGGLGALVGARWTARHRPAPEPAGARPGEDACPSQMDDRQVASLRARVQFLEERLAAASAAPSALAAESELPPPEEAAAAPAAPAAPAAQPALVVASKLYQDQWARDAQDRLVEAARGAGVQGDSAGVTCTRDECRVEIATGEGEPAAERVHKILSEVSPYLQSSNVMSDEATGKTTIVFARQAAAQGG
jgi:hypothetical protein